MNHHKRRIKEDLRIGIQVGLAVSAAFSLLATAAFLVLLVNGEASALKKEFGLNFPEIILLYVVGGLVGGIFIGLLRPLRSTAVGSFVIGTVSGLPCFLAFMLISYARGDWYPFGVLIAVGGSMALCGSLGILLYYRTKGWTK